MLLAFNHWKCLINIVTDVACSWMNWACAFCCCDDLALMLLATPFSENLTWNTCLSYFWKIFYGKKCSTKNYTQNSGLKNILFISIVSCEKAELVPAPFRHDLMQIIRLKTHISYTSMDIWLNKLTLKKIYTSLF